MTSTEVFILADNSGPMNQHEEEVRWMLHELRHLLAEQMGGPSCTEMTVPSILEIFVNPMYTSLLKPPAEGVDRLIVCITNSECEDGTSRMLIESALADLPSHVFLIFATTVTDEATKAWFEYLINKHPAYGKKFSITRDYAGESLDDEFARCIQQLLER